MIIGEGPLISFPNVVTVACGALTWLVGVFLVKQIRFLARYNFPAPVVGGLVVAVVFAIMHERHLPLPKFDTELVNSLMIGFFASLGFGASLRELKKGGRAVITFLLACSILLVVQVAVGVVMASLLGEHHLLGVMASIVSLVGGPGTALAFAPSFEQAGLQNAATIGLAAAMGGIMLGGILSGPVATILIRRNRLDRNELAQGTNDNAAAETSSEPSRDLSSDLVWQAAYLLIVGSIGWYLSKGLYALNIKLPFYIGAMVIASIVRNIDDSTGIFKLNMKVIDAIGTACLTFFVATMMMSLELWSVASAALALIAMLAAQTFVVCMAALTIMFYASGKDYDAAVTSGGLVGFMLGTTATALAAMGSVSQKYGTAPRAFLVVPIVGACFIDFINAVVISISLNIFG